MTIDIDNLTLKQAKELKKLFEQKIYSINGVNDRTDTEYDFVGKRVLIRAHRKGVQVGIVENVEGEFIRLSPSRKLWWWKAKKSIALESLAKYGVAKETKATAIVNNDYIRLDDVCGIIELTGNVYEEIMNLPDCEQD